MTAAWDKISKLAEEFEAVFNSTGESIEGTLDHKYDWHNTLWTSSRYRRAHVEVVDKRDTHKIFILHTTVFPHTNDPSPIWGFDAVCGPTKITGAFHDFSITGDPDNFMWLWFNAQVHDLEWNKPRELPDWAKQIFSPAMIAAGNLQEESEIDQLCATALTTLNFYVNNVGLEQKFGADYRKEQNRYCYYQKQNPRVIRSMVSMGVYPKIMESFVDEILFPEI